MKRDLKSEKSFRIIGYIKILIFVLLVVLISFVTAHADSSVSISDGEPSVGDAFTATVYYSGTSFGSTDGVLSYDPSILEFTGCSTEWGGGGGEVRYSYYQSDGEPSMAISFYFTVIGSGDGYVSASADSYDIDGNYFSAESSGASFVSGGQADAQAEPDSQSDDESSKNDEQDDNQVDESSEANDASDQPEDGDSSHDSSSDEGQDIENSDDQSQEEKQNDETAENSEDESEDGPRDEEQTDADSEQEDPAASTDNKIIIKIGDKEYIPATWNEKDIPSGFTPSSITYQGNQIKALKSDAGDITLCYLQENSHGDDKTGVPSFFIYDDAKKAFTAANLIDIKGAKYLLLSSDIQKVYGNSAYYYYDKATGNLTPESIAISGDETGASAPASNSDESVSDTGSNHSSGVSKLLAGLACALLIGVIAIQAMILKKK